MTGTLNGLQGAKSIAVLYRAAFRLSGGLPFGQMQNRSGGSGRPQGSNAPPDHFYAVSCIYQSSRCQTPNGPPSWTAAALLPLSPSTACCGDSSQVPTNNSQQQAAEIKAAAGLPQSRGRKARTAAHHRCLSPCSGTDPAPVEPRFGNDNTARHLHAQAPIGLTSVELRIGN